MVRLALRALCLASVLLAGANAAAAPDERVPRVRNDDLPVVGTCAPIGRENVTHVMVGKVGWYRVAGVDKPLSFEQLQTLLEGRAGTERPSPHGVWLQASRRHVWAHIVKARLACAQAGIYRVGLRVISESDKRIYGFPLFLPAAKGPTGPAAGVGSRLPIVIDPVKLEAPRKSEGTSDPRVLYQVAAAAREKYDQDVVAEVRIGNNVNLQYALTVFDMLYRAGCVAVRIKTLTMVSRVQDANHTHIRIVRKPRYPKDAVLPVAPVSPVVVPAVAPRSRPWSLYGADRPGAMYLELAELPVPGEERPTRARAAGGAYPNYLRRGSMPESVRPGAETRVLRWARELGPTLLEGKASSARIKDEMVIRLRPAEKLAPMLGPVSKAFKDADRIDVTTLRLDVIALHEGQPVGLLDLTLHLAGGEITCNFARISGASVPAARNLPPEPVDPYAAGVPGDLRVWLEGLLVRLRRDPAATVPLTTLRDALATLPAVSHESMRRADPARAREAANLARFVRSQRFDRIVLRVREAVAAVSSRGQVVGVLRFGLESEEKTLRINALDPRRSR